ncbi:MAG TPA: glycosyltransferase [Xanthobacteraceae bacterium]
MSSRSSLEQILLAQIEHHRTEVFYNLDPIRYPSDFVGKLPGCVKKTICWRAAPSGYADFSKYDIVVCNFSSIREIWKARGCRVGSFFPAIDPVMDEYVVDERPIDILFVGGYSRHHSVRARMLEQIARLDMSRKVVFCLDTSRLTRLAESPFGRLLPLRKHRRPSVIANITRPPIFGRQLYELIGRSKIVINGAIDMAGHERGNMRCFEAMGLGALLVSDAGKYPAGMEAGVTIEVYDSPDGAVKIVGDSLDDWPRRASIAVEGRRRVTELYTKSLQWSAFVDIVAEI